jgi:hypothetical protein
MTTPEKSRKSIRKENLTSVDIVMIMHLSEIEKRHG